MSRENNIVVVKDACGTALGYEDPVFRQDQTYSLAHVLLAMNYVFSGESGRIPYNVQPSRDTAYYVRFECKDIRAHHEMFWSLRRDDLTQQSDECVASLFDLLQ